MDEDRLAPRQGRLLSGIGPEKLTLRQDGAGRLPAQVALIERLGSDMIIGCRILSGGRAPEADLIANDLVFAKVAGGVRLKLNELCSLHYSPTDVPWFDEHTGERIPAIEQKSAGWSWQ